MGSEAEWTTRSLPSESGGELGAGGEAREKEVSWSGWRKERTEPSAKPRMRWARAGATARVERGAREEGEAGERRVERRRVGGVGRVSQILRTGEGEEGSSCAGGRWG